MSETEPESLAEIALLRLGRDETTPFVLTVGLQEPYPVDARSYGTVAGRAAALAERLTASGLARGDRVGCYFPNAPSWVAAVLGIWWAGGVPAMVGTLLPGPEAARLFAIADVATVIAAADAPELLGEFRIIRVDDEGRLLDGPAATPVGHYELPRPEDTGAIFFTSGTTGMPKGITHTHGAIMEDTRRVARNFARTQAYRPDPAPAHLAPGVAFNPFGHTAGFGRLALRMWIGRPTLLIPKFSVAAARAVLANFSVDSFQLTPTMIQMMATAEDPPDLSGLRYVTSGTAPLPAGVRDRFESRFGVPVIQGYGMSEIGGVSQERLEDIAAGTRGPGAVGRITVGIEVRIQPRADDRLGEGEVMVRSSRPAPEFVGGAKPPIDADGWFATGDIGRLSDGILYITGRAQEKIIVGGFNVYPAELEDIAREFRQVVDVVVIGVDDDRLGEKPVAGVVWASEPAETELLDYMRSRLAHYKVPRALFSIPSVPLTPRGKVDRRAAAELARRTLAEAG